MSLNNRLNEMMKSRREGLQYSSDPYQSIIKQLRQKRKLLDMTQLELSALVSKTRVSIANIESGRQHLSLGLFLKMCEALNLQWNDFNLDESKGD